MIPAEQAKRPKRRRPGGRVEAAHPVRAEGGSETDPVLAVLRDMLFKDPKLSNDALRRAAEQVDPSVARLDARQFNARYALTAKRGLGLIGKGAAKKAAKKVSPRPAPRAVTGNGAAPKVRAILIEFARDLTSAKNRAAVVEVIADMDTYVDRILKATS